VNERRRKAAQSGRSVSEIVNDAVHAALAEDHEDLRAFEDRAGEPKISYEALRDRLRVHSSLEN
jgi:hypothetical protein